MDLHRTVGLETPSLRRADVEVATGVPSERSIRWWRAMGFPEVSDDDVAFSDLDVDLVRRIEQLEEAGLVADDDVARVARILGVSCQRIAEAQLALVDEMLARFPDADPEVLHRDRLRRLFDQDDPTLMALLERGVVYVWRRHMLAALGRRLDADDDAAHTDVAAVGFADLSGFTKFSKHLSPEELTAVIDTFEAAAFQVVAGTDARVVKLIGDEVMWVAPTLDRAVRVALDLRDHLADSGAVSDDVAAMPPLHCGVAVGPTVAIGGDVFGATVNLASRLTSIARRGTVVVPRADADQLVDVPGLVVRPARRSYTLRGIGDVRIAVVDRASTHD